MKKHTDTHKKAAEQERLNREAKVKQLEDKYKVLSPNKRFAVYLCMLPLAPIGYALLALSWARAKWGKQL